jgi:hypothetical protein
MFFIAQRFGVSLSALIAANPHIPNPNLIFPGDVLCVPPPPPPPPPHPVPTPCCLILQPLLGAPPGIAGSALLYRDGIGIPSVAVIAALPHPGIWGDFDAYVAGATLGDEIAADQMIQTPGPTIVWAAAVNLPETIPPIPQVHIEIRPVNVQLGAIGEPVMVGVLGGCH